MGAGGGGYVSPVLSSRYWFNESSENVIHICGIACVTAPQGSIGHRLHLNSFKGLVSPMSDKFLVFYMSGMMRFLQFYGY